MINSNLILKHVLHYNRSHSLGSCELEVEKSQ